MCRITGFWQFKKSTNLNLSKVLTEMRDTMVYGGPDDAGIYIEEKSGLGLGHRRLSIIDLSEKGHQPMCSDDGRYWITYNGEVYNFEQIKNELLQKGYRFNSHSDTEVIIKSFQEWGFDSVAKFRGMFAFAIWDRNKEELTLCRDRVGIKPLYWYHKDNLFLFSSELKAFHKHPGFYKEIDYDGLATFLTYGYISAPKSIFRHTYKLEPGHFLTVGKDQRIKKTKYWDIADYYQEGMELERNGYWLKKTDQEIEDELESILKESFRYRMVADVPVGVFLSGGVDSSLVSALLTDQGFKLKTFTIGFTESKYNEANHAESVANYLGTDHTEEYCTTETAAAIIPRLPALYDEPYGDSSSIPTHLVSIIAKKKVKVSLSADGGDEFFCGYNRYSLVGEKVFRIRERKLLQNLIHISGLIRPEILQAVYNKFKFMLPKYNNFSDKINKLREVIKADDFMQAYRLSLSHFLPGELDEMGIYTNVSNNAYKIEGMDRFHQMMLYDTKSYLPDDILVKVDRASMGVALEAREPLLDHKILEFSARLPIRYKYQGGVKKKIIKNILKKYVPENLTERPKQGFSVPIYNWFKKDLKEYFNDYLNEQRIREEAIFNTSKINNLLNGYHQNNGVNVTKLWFLLMFEMWKDTWMN